MTRQVIFSLPNGDSEQRWLNIPPGVGSIVVVAGSEWVVVRVDDQRCVLEPLSKTLPQQPLGVEQ